MPTGGGTKEAPSFHVSRVPIVYVKSRKRGALEGGREEEEEAHAHVNSRDAH